TRAGRDVVVRLTAEALDGRRELEERVVAEARHRRVPGASPRPHPEAERPLLAAADAVEAPVAERHHLSAALVEHEVGVGDVGPLPGEPLRAGMAADLLVDDGEDLELA